MSVFVTTSEHQGPQPPMNIDAQGARQIQMSFTQFQAFRREEYLCDCQLLTENDKGVVQRHPVHRLLFAAVSPFFRQLFLERRHEPMSQIRLSNCSSGAVEALIHFVYTGQLPLANNNLITELLSLADYCGIQSLAEKLTTFVVAERQPRNVGNSHQLPAAIPQLQLKIPTNGNAVAIDPRLRLLEQQQQMATAATETEVLRQRLISSVIQQQQQERVRLMCVKHAIVDCALCAAEESRLVTTPPATFTSNSNGLTPQQLNKTVTAMEILAEVASTTPATATALRQQQQQLLAQTKAATEFEREKQYLQALAIEQQRMETMRQQQRHQQLLQQQQRQQQMAAVAASNGLQPHNYFGGPPLPTTTAKQHSPPNLLEQQALLPSPPADFHSRPELLSLFINGLQRQQAQTSPIAPSVSERRQSFTVGDNTALQKHISLVAGGSWHKQAFDELVRGVQPPKAPTEHSAVTQLLPNPIRTQLQPLSLPTTTAPTNTQMNPFLAHLSPRVVDSNQKLPPPPQPQQQQQPQQQPQQQQNRKATNASAKTQPQVSPDLQSRLGNDTIITSSDGEQMLQSGDNDGWCRNKKYIDRIDKGFKCCLCEKIYGRYNSVSYHVTIYHRNPPIHCDQAGCQFTTREARYIHFHKYYRHGIALPDSIDLGSRKCPFCRHVSKSPAILEKHLGRHLPNVVKTNGVYHCDRCTVETATLKLMAVHLLNHEADQTDESGLISLEGELKSTEMMAKTKLKTATKQLKATKVRKQKQQRRVTGSRTASSVSSSVSGASTQSPQSVGEDDAPKTHSQTTLQLFGCPMRCGVAFARQQEALIHFYSEHSAASRAPATTTAAAAIVGSPLMSPTMVTKTGKTEPQLLLSAQFVQGAQ